MTCPDCGRTCVPPESKRPFCPACGTAPFTRSAETLATIYWEGADYPIKAAPGYEGKALDFVSLCQQLGPEGRRDLLDVLTINYRDEVVKELGITGPRKV